VSKLNIHIAIQNFDKPFIVLLLRPKYNLISLPVNRNGEKADRMTRFFKIGCIDLTNLKINYIFAVIKYRNNSMSKLFSLSDASSIAIHAIVMVAKSEIPLNVIQIADATSTSKHHVAKVMQRLVKDGFISSQRGPTGGFMLKKTASDITFLDVYESIEGKIEIHKCMFEIPVCPMDKCIMNNITQKMSEEFVQYLKSQNLANYVK
jgi:Rrf2 family protein